MSFWGWDGWFWTSNVAEWVSGAGTVGALVFAGKQIRNDTHATRDARDQTNKSIELTEKSLKMQADRDEADRNERTAAQAALIGCDGRYKTSSAGDVFRVDMGNSSAVSVYNVRGFVVRDDMTLEQTPEPGGQIRHTETTYFTFESVDSELVPVGRRGGVTFRDNAGAYWLKWADGQLERMETEYATEHLKYRLNGAIFVGDLWL